MIVDAVWLANFASEATCSTVLNSNKNSRKRRRRNNSHYDTACVSRDCEFNATCLVQLKSLSNQVESSRFDFKKSPIAVAMQVQSSSCRLVVAKCTKFEIIHYIRQTGSGSGSKAVCVCVCVCRNEQQLADDHGSLRCNRERWLDRNREQLSARSNPIQSSQNFFSLSYRASCTFLILSSQLLKFNSIQFDTMRYDSARFGSVDLS